MQLQPGVGRIQPADDPIQAEHLGVGDERQPDIVLCGLRLQAPVPLHQLDHVPPVDLHDVVHISPGHPQADQDLDDKLIPRRRDVAGRGAKPAVQLGTPGRGDRKSLLRPCLALVAGLHQPVALKALQGDVHLPHIQRPHLAGPLLELLLQTQAVLRPLAEQGQQGMPDAHRPSQTLIITVSIIVIVRTASAGASRTSRNTLPARKAGPGPGDEKDGIVHPRVRETSARPSVVLAATECPYLGATPTQHLAGRWRTELGGYGIVGWMVFSHGT